eukprot:1165346-Rhodomonas_salina.1
MAAADDDPLGLGNDDPLGLENDGDDPMAEVNENPVTGVHDDPLGSGGDDLTGYQKSLKSLMETAIEAENNKAVAALLEGKADPEWRDAGGNTALMQATATGNKSVVKALLRAGADMQARNPKGEG